MLERSAHHSPVRLVNLYRVASMNRVLLTMTTEHEPGGTMHTTQEINLWLVVAVMAVTIGTILYLVVHEVTPSLLQ